MTSNGSTVFHQSEKAGSAFGPVPHDDPERALLMMAVSRQRAVEEPQRKVAIPISHAEAAVLETVLRAAATASFGW